MDCCRGLEWIVAEDVDGCTLHLWFEVTVCVRDWGILPPGYWVSLQVVGGARSGFNSATQKAVPPNFPSSTFAFTSVLLLLRVFFILPFPSSRPRRILTGCSKTCGEWNFSCLCVKSDVLRALRPSRPPASPLRGLNSLFRLQGCHQPNEAARISFPTSHSRTHAHTPPPHTHTSSAGFVSKA